MKFSIIAVSMSVVLASDSPLKIDNKAAVAARGRVHAGHAVVARDQVEAGLALAPRGELDEDLAYNQPSHCCNGNGEEEKQQQQQ
ncbi:hypothetical protein LX36DRAFT_714707 [Colletotrichum falcatum]|nr:hypothetical protein LX36DRAFT_714707 [Colletotrichum falcatum]